MSLQEINREINRRSVGVWEIGSGGAGSSCGFLNLVA